MYEVERYNKTSTTSQWQVYQYKKIYKNQKQTKQQRMNKSQEHLRSLTARTSNSQLPPFVGSFGCLPLR